MMTSRAKRFAVAGLLGITLCSSGAGIAQTGYPNKPIRLIVGFPPGVLSDVTARLISSGMGSLGQPIVVENRPGAATLIGVRAVVDAAPDGYTLGYISSAIAQARVLSTSWNVDPESQLVPISQTVEFPLAFAVNPKKHSATTLAEFLKAVKSNPGGFNYAAVASTSGDALVLKLLNHAAGVDVTVINYKGGAAGMQAVLAGEADAFMVSPQTARAQVAQNTLRLLAVTGESRFRTLPQVPTLRELGYPGITLRNWFGFMAPPGTSRNVVQTVHGAILAALRNPQVTTPLYEAGTDIVGNSPEEFGRAISAEIATYRKMVSDGLVKPE